MQDPNYRGALNGRVGRAVEWLGWVLVTVASALPVGATTVNYDSVVTFAQGPHAEIFPPGAAVSISYALDPAATDSSSDPQTGYFRSAVLSLSVSVPDAGVAVVADAPGTAQTFNNVVDASSQVSSDQVYIFGGQISSPSLLARELITSVEVDFLSDFTVSEPTMLSDDGLPLSTLRFHDGFVRFETETGDTVVDFADTASQETATPTSSPTSTPLPDTPSPTSTAVPAASPTPAGTATATETPGFGLSGGGCMVNSGDGTGLADAWPLLLLPTLLVLGRRRSTARSET